MKKILFVCPHLSTGGMPQYVLKQVEALRKTHTVAVVEVSNYSDEFTVQRKRIKALCKVKQLLGNQDLLFHFMLEFQPDVIHFQEVPETFLSKEVLDKVFNTSRKYFIVITTHSSLTTPSDFKHLPDKIVAVNRWQKDYFQANMPSTNVDMWEYPIVSLYKNTENARVLLNFKDGFHVLNVGLFTRGKNQGEIFEVARALPDVTFHFVGNRAGNFQEYWEPLMQNKPSNCIIWGEKDDTSLFYQAADLFYFSSRFELNPLVIKEALGYKLPVMMYRLATYLDDYDNNPLVEYLDGDINTAISIIKRKIQSS